jgi:hypothetical protein
VYVTCVTIEDGRGGSGVLCHDAVWTHLSTQRNKDTLSGMKNNNSGLDGGLKKITVLRREVD